jgi:pSer/pThr/pTyr-binding forkhead associated (FHA) protein
VVFCTKCGHRNPPEANFCSSCGNALTEPPSGAETTVTFVAVDAGGEPREQVVEDEVQEAAARGAAVLVVRSGPDTGAGFVLDATVTNVGRHPESEIFLDDITVSRRHAEFRRDGDAYIVRDVGSLNGTYVNRERIEETELHQSDEVQIGKFKLVFLSSGSN